MAVVERTIPVPPEDVFRVLADPRTFADFVVGSRTIRRFDPSWPDVGTAVHHTIGVWPLVVRDQTRVLELREPHYLKLMAGFGPLGEGPIEFWLDPTDDGGTHVRVEEKPTAGPLAAVWNPVLARVMEARNHVMLQRLHRMAERREELRRRLTLAA